MLDHLKADDNASYKPFQTTEELHDLIENDLALLLTERFDQVRAATPTREAAAPEAKRVILPVQRTSLVDRIDQTEKAQAWLTRPEVGLVTLTGPGGAGKRVEGPGPARVGMEQGQGSPDGGVEQGATPVGVVVVLWLPQPRPAATTTTNASWRTGTDTTIRLSGRRAAA